MSTEKSELVVDFDVLWQGLARSAQVRNQLARVAENIKTVAEGLARVVAYDDGWYSREFDAGTLSARRARQIANARGRARQGKGYHRGAVDNRRRRGQYGKHPYLDTQFEGNPDQEVYDGQLGVVINRDFKAVWVEYGSIVKGPRRVMLTASEAVAKQMGGIEVEVLYQNYHQANATELSAKQKAGHTKQKVRRVARLLSTSGPGA